VAVADFCGLSYPFDPVDLAVVLLDFFPDFAMIRLLGEGAEVSARAVVNQGHFETRNPEVFTILFKIVGLIL
jgi:hypothetical protein